MTPPLVPVLYGKRRREKEKTYADIIHFPPHPQAESKLGLTRDRAPLQVTASCSGGRSGIRGDAGATGTRAGRVPCFVPSEHNSVAFESGARSNGRVSG